VPPTREVSDRERSMTSLLDFPGDALNRILESVRGIARRECLGIGIPLRRDVMSPAWRYLRGSTSVASAAILEHNRERPERPLQAQTDGGSTRRRCGVRVPMAVWQDPWPGLAVGMPMPKHSRLAIPRTDAKIRLGASPGKSKARRASPWRSVPISGQRQPRASRLRSPVSATDAPTDTSHRNVAPTTSV
jgi:hypothetical protein